MDVRSNLSESDVRELAAVRTDNSLVLSLYVDLSVSRFPTRGELLEQVDSLLGQASKRLRSSDVPKNRAKASVVDLERVRRFVELEMSREGSESMAAFVCSEVGLARAYMLARPLRPRARFDRSPYVRPLSSLLTEYSKIGVIACSRREGRLLRFHLGRPAGEEIDVYDPVHRKHDQGGWSQARFARHIEAEVQRHFDHVANRAADYFGKYPVDYIVLVGPREDTTELRDHLSTELRSKVVRELNIDPRARSHELQKALDEIDAAIEEESDAKLVDALRDGLGSHTAVSGLENTLRALNEGKVGTLLVSRGFVRGGWRCQECGALAAIGPRCSMCGAEATERVDDIVEEAIQAAWSNGTAVELVSRSADLDVLGRIGALLRYR